MEISRFVQSIWKLEEASKGTVDDRLSIFDLASSVILNYRRLPEDHPLQIPLDFIAVSNSVSIVLANGATLEYYFGEGKWFGWSGKWEGVGA